MHELPGLYYREFLEFKKIGNWDPIPIEKILVRNLESVKKIADKEGININNLFKKLKNNEQ